MPISETRVDSSGVSTPPKEKPWVVLKFGGTSVSSGKTWNQIVNRVKELSPKYRVLVVLSALSQVTNRIDKSIREAVDNEELTSLAWIEETHRRLAKETHLDASALQGVMEYLTEMGELLQGLSMIREASARIKARLMAYGEKMSTVMAVSIMKQAGIKAALMAAGDLLITDTPLNALDEDKYLEANVFPRRDPEYAQQIIDDKVGPGCEVLITQGFTARNAKNEICLLGRGGSDTSGALLAALLGAHHLEIWTDVYGMFTGDPRIMPHVRLIQRISSREAQELATSGAKVLHPRCIVPCAMNGVPIEIRNTMDPGPEYTLITVDDYCKRVPASEGGSEKANGTPQAPRQGNFAIANGSAGASPKTSPFASPRSASPSQEAPVPPMLGMGMRRFTMSDLKALDTRPSAFCGVVSQKGCIMITLTTLEMWGATGFLVRCFTPFQQYSISVDQVATSQSGISVTVSHVPGGIEGDAFQGLLQELMQFGEVEVTKDVAVVTVVGRRIRERLPDLGRAMEAFTDVEVLMVSASSEDVAMSFVVREDKATLLTEVLHHELIPIKGGDQMFGSTFQALKEKDLNRRESMELADAAAAAKDALQALRDGVPK